MNSICLKVWKIDYDFIISNYLDRSLWKKQWNLFTYKDYNFTLELRSIQVSDMSICFTIRFNRLENNSEWIYYYLDHPDYNINVLKKQINGAIFSLMTKYEENLIKNTSEYRRIQNTQTSEINALTDIATEFLDSEGVTNNDIRDAYIDSYVSNNTTVTEQLYNYISYSKYNYLTELMLVFVNAIGDINRLNIIKGAQNNDERLQDILDKIETKEKQLDEEDYDDYKDNLESI